MTKSSLLNRNIFIFHSGSVSQSLPYQVTTKIFFETVTLLKGDACQELTAGSCPVSPGKQFSYATAFHVGEYFPNVMSIRISFILQKLLSKWKFPNA